MRCYIVSVLNINIGLFQFSTLVNKISSYIQFTKNGVFITNGEEVQGWYYVLQCISVEYNIFIICIQGLIATPIPEVSPIDPLSEICSYERQAKKLRLWKKPIQAFGDR